MFQPTTRRLLVRTLVLTLAVALPSSSTRATEKSGRDAQPFKVDAKVALASFVSIADGHLQAMAHSLQILARSQEARSAEWKSVEQPLRELGSVNVSALNWFALPDGSYWSVQKGREQGNLSTRPYFPKVLAGNTIIGDLVLSKATGKSVAIVAVPVKDRDGAIAGVLGASIYLDKLSERVRDEMSLTSDLIFYSFDASPLLALAWDPGLIFTSPKQLGPEVDRAFTEMLSKSDGVVKYTFRGKLRTVVFRKSAVTGWWYALGFVKTQPTPRT